MVMVKTSELTGAALDWAVAKAVPQTFWPVIINNKIYLDTDYDHVPYSPSTCWDQLGPLIEKYQPYLTPDNDGQWSAQIWVSSKYVGFLAPNILIATCRAIVVSQLGDEFDVPEVLLFGNLETEGGEG